VWRCGAVAGSVRTAGEFDGTVADEPEVDDSDSATELRSSVSEPSQYRTATSPAARPAMTPRATSMLRTHVSRLRVPVILTGIFYPFCVRLLISPVRSAALNDSRRKRGRQRTKPVSNLSEMRLDGGAVTQKSINRISSSISIWPFGRIESSCEVGRDSRGMTGISPKKRNANWLVSRMWRDDWHETEAQRELTRHFRCPIVCSRFRYDGKSAGIFAFASCGRHNGPGHLG
jgi:hypothetical protein